MGNVCNSDQQITDNHDKKEKIDKNIKLKTKYHEDVQFREEYKSKRRERYHELKKKEYLDKHGYLEGFKINTYNKNKN